MNNTCIKECCKAHVDYWTEIVLRLETIIEQLRGALGYPVKGNISQDNTILNGIADALSKQITALEAESTTQKETIKFLKEQLRKYQRTMIRRGEALEQYADKNLWQGCNCHDPLQVIFTGQVKFYGYEIAAEALKGGEDEI